jgi:MoxR-like ATPase
MDNNNVIEGIKVLSLNRAAMENFKNVGVSVGEGREIPAFLEGNSGDSKRIVVSIEERESGQARNKVCIGKITPDTCPDEGVYDIVVALIESGCEAKFYGTDGPALLLKVRVKRAKKETSSGINSAKEEARVISILGQDGYNERVEALAKHGIKRGSLLFKLVLGLIRESGETLPKPKEYKNLNPKEVSPVFKLLSNLAVGNHPILEGEKSLGKNVAWSYVSWILNAKIIPLQCHERLTQADMLGYLSSDISNKEKMTEDGFRAKLASSRNGEWSDEAVIYQTALDKSQSPDLVFTEGPVVKALNRANEGFGTILLLDEMNLADGNLISGVFNMLTDGSSDRIYVTGVGEISIPKDCLFIGATQNPPTGNYTGINSQNTATQSRFTAIQMPKVPSIAPVLKREAERWDVPEFIVDKFNEVYSKFKELALDGEDSISTDSLNIRGFESAVRLCGIGRSAKDAITEGVINTCGDIEERITLSSMLDNFVDSKGDFIQ